MYNFERAGVKIQRGQAVTDRDKLKAVEHLLKFRRPEPAAAAEHQNPNVEFIRGMKEAAESSTASPDGEYVDLGHVIGRSDIVERLFSVCRLIISDRRKRMGPETLDLIVMLKYNQDLWSGDRDNESPCMAARVIHIDNEEKKREIRRLHEEQKRVVAHLPRDDNAEEDHFDDRHVHPDHIICAWGID